MMANNLISEGAKTPLSDVDEANSSAAEVLPVSPARTRTSQPSLRPPTLMIDLLFGALMLFAFQMGDPNAVTIAAKDFDIPTANAKAPEKETRFLVLKPIKTGNSAWVYETPDGKTLAAIEVVNMANAQGSKPIFLMPKHTSVQSYIDAEQPLRELGVKPALSVAQQ